MRKLFLLHKSFSMLFLGVVFSLLVVADPAAAQRRLSMLEAGTTINVRTTEDIKADESDGRVFMGVVDRDVVDRSGNVSIPAGSDVELIVKPITDEELAIDLDAITVNGQRFGVNADTTSVTGEDREGVGINRRTGKYVGGGALLGAIIGGITGGGKGAAIGAGAGAAAGAGVQVLTRGREISIPTESLLTFRLQQPLRNARDTGFTRNGVHYHNGYAATSATQDNSAATTPAYRAGLQAGRSDRDRNSPLNTRTDRWTTRQERADYEAGYRRGYEGNNTAVSQAPATDLNSRGTLRIQRDNNIRWQAQEVVRIYVQVDNNPRQLFAEGQSGLQLASWIERGHVYTFIMQDANGNELARDRLDLR